VAYCLVSCFGAWFPRFLYKNFFMAIVVKYILFNSALFIDRRFQNACSCETLQAARSNMFIPPAIFQDPHKPPIGPLTPHVLPFIVFYYVHTSLLSDLEFMLDYHGLLMRPAWRSIVIVTLASLGIATGRFPLECKPRDPQSSWVDSELNGLTCIYSNYLSKVSLSQVE